ncbi:MAG: serine hydrolase [Gemmatimonadota bacterium]|jgi:CubicO group peptidase (beta-lactamase class C family)
MSVLPPFIRLSGLFGPALFILGCVVLVLSARAVWTAAKTKDRGGQTVLNQANAILFWGGASAVLGFLGQCQGTYLALGAILSAPEISPQVVAEGFVISFVPTLFGLGILGFSLVAWGTLRLVPRMGSGALLIFLLAFSGAGCDSRAESRADSRTESQADTPPTRLTEGVWEFQGGPTLFLWEFMADSSGNYSCLVHDFYGGRKYMETPCASVSLDWDYLELRMSTGTRYQGRVELERGRIDGRLLYPDGSSLEAPFYWAPLADHPELLARPPGSETYAYSSPRDLDDGWILGNAADYGVDPVAIDETVQAILSGGAGVIKSLLIARRGTLLAEEYFYGYGPDHLFPIASCTKSVSSLLVGLAVQEGLIPGVGEPLLNFFPQERAAAAEGWEDLTLEQLLTMSLALNWSPEEAESVHGTGPEAFRQILARTVAGRPGVDWAYVNMNVNLLAGVLRQATGEQAEAFAARTLFGPLGITEWDWDPMKTEGFNLMDGSLRLRARDMARIGVMVANGGEWQGQRIVAEDWIRNSIRPHLSADDPDWRYGYLWWTREVPISGGGSVHAVMANGWGSQFIFLFPELDLVIVTTGGNQENGKHLAIGEVLLRELLPGVSLAADLGSRDTDYPSCDPAN